MSAGADLIAAERLRQIEALGLDAKHDDEHDDEAMAWAAACYLLTGRYAIDGQDVSERLWPWEREWWKPGDRIRDLTRAGALIAAEIDRLQRKGDGS